MTQTVADPPTVDLEETTLMTVWPTIGATAAGRFVGRLAAVGVGPGRFFTLGKLLALATIPLSLAAFFWQLAPFVCRRYRLTTRRIAIQKGLKPADAESIGLDEFDAIDVVVLPGQAWLQAGDLVFRRDGAEVFRLAGVPRPEVCRQALLTAQTAVLAVRQTLAQQTAAAG